MKTIQNTFFDLQIGLQFEKTNYKTTLVYIFEVGLMLRKIKHEGHTISITILDNTLYVDSFMIYLVS